MAERVLVTGASGFIGRRLAAYLVDRGYDVRGTHRGASAAAAATGVDWVRVGDLGDTAAMERALAGVRTVVHLAARVHVLRERATNPLAEFRRVNAEGTRALLRVAQRAGRPRFVFLSTVAVYGSSPPPRIDDRTPPAPDTPYGISKHEGERAVADYASATGSPSFVVRVPGVYGPGMKGNIPRLFRLIDRGIPVPVSETNRRSLLYVENLCAAVGALLGVDAGAGEPYLVADREALSTADLARRIGAALDRPPRLMHLPERSLRTVGRLGDALSRALPFPLTTVTVDRLFGSLVIDSSALRAKSGYTPPVDVDDALRETADWYRRTCK